jgi:hypothetical protein
MNRTGSTAAVVTAITALVGCVGAGGLQQQLRSASGELMYLHDTDGSPERRPEAIGLASVTVNPPLPPATIVTRTGGYVVPLLFINFWTGEYQGTLGASELKSDLAGFVRSSLVEELTRSSAYAYSDQDPALRLEVSISKVLVSAPVREQGSLLFLLFWVSYSKFIQGGPVDVVLEGEVVVRRGAQELLRRPIRGRARAGGAPVKDWKVPSLTVTMVEGLSLAVKVFNERIVQEVNSMSPCDPRDPHRPPGVCP